MWFCINLLLYFYLNKGYKVNDCKYKKNYHKKNMIVQGFMVGNRVLSHRSNLSKWIKFNWSLCVGVWISVWLKNHFIDLLQILQTDRLNTGIYSSLNQSSGFKIVFEKIIFRYVAGGHGIVDNAPCSCQECFLSSALAVEICQESSA